MKTAFFVILALVIGLALGTFYGWRSGFVDGQVQTQITTLATVKKYGTLRAATDTSARDRLIDVLAMDSSVVFANGHSYSPLFTIFHPKADVALLEVAAYWDLNSREPSIWNDGKIHPLFPENSPEAKRLEQLKQQMRTFYDRELEKQQKQRNAPPPGDA